MKDLTLKEQLDLINFDYDKDLFHGTNVDFDSSGNDHEYQKKMLSRYLLENKLTPSIEYIDLYNFIKYIECFRYIENLNINNFYYKHKAQLGLYYFAAGAGLSQSTEALLEDLGVNKNRHLIYNKILSNSIQIFDKIINTSENNYYNTYCKLAKTGELDTLPIQF